MLKQSGFHSTSLLTGLAALQAMNAKDVQERKGWEISYQKRSGQWFSGDEFCQVLEGKGIQYN